jgi:hypothetical protein
MDEECMEHPDGSMWLKKCQIPTPAGVRNETGWKLETVVEVVAGVEQGLTW